MNFFHCPCGLESNCLCNSDDPVSAPSHLRDAWSVEIKLFFSFSSSQMGDRLQNACCQQMGGRRDWVASGAGGLHKQLNFVLIFQFILSRANHVFFFCFVSIITFRNRHGSTWDFQHRWQVLKKLGELKTDGLITNLKYYHTNNNNNIIILK